MSLQVQGLSYAHPNKDILFQNISFSINLYKEYTSLKSRELEDLSRFRVMS